MQFAEEGAAKVFKPAIGSGFIVGVVGALQFEVLASRIELEYGIPVRFEAASSPAPVGSVAPNRWSMPLPKRTRRIWPMTMTGIWSI